MCKKEIIIELPKIIVRYPQMSRGRVSMLLSLALVLSLPAVMDTEEVKITTYYPAPLGLYTKMKVTQDTTLATQSGNVGVGTNSPAFKLDVNGIMNAADIYKNGAPLPSGVPQGAVMFFNLPGCPSGWSPLNGSGGLPDTRGRYLVSLPAGGALAGAQGSALSNLENRPVGQHVHDLPDYNPAGNYNPGISGWDTNSLGQPTSHTTLPTGNVPGTNAPYIQFLVCQKN